ncbi:MAG: beta-galactosidase trimerization domain-containing protein [Pirellulales bacterium]|nr:beta-galactosidase trimerization domain-containing protein [Pirellulales bacterium]
MSFQFFQMFARPVWLPPSGARTALATAIVWLCGLLAIATSHADQGPPPADDGSSAAGNVQRVISSATDAEKDLLLEARSIQPRTVVALSESVTTAQAIRRARNYLAAWHGKTSEDGLPEATELAAVTKELTELQERFLTLYHAHYGNRASAALAVRMKIKETPPLVPVTEEAVRLSQDVDARAAVRVAFMRDLLAGHNRCQALLQNLREQLVDLQRGAGVGGQLPEFNPTPAFVDKTPASILPDGTVTGIVMTVQGLLDHPGTDVLRGDYTCGMYEAYISSDTGSGDAWKPKYIENQAFDPNYTLDPMAINARYGRKTQIIVPCSVQSWTFCPADWFRKHSHLELSRPDAPQEYTGSWLWSLDLYQPAVREMLEGYLKRVGERHRGNPSVLMYTTAWESSLTSCEPGHADYRYAYWPSGGRTEAGLAAFRQHLAKKYGSIGPLNSTWGSSHASFDGISLPVDSIKSPEAERKRLTDALYQGRADPAYYEFHSFLLESYADYLAWCYQQLKQADPTHAISVSPTYGEMDGYLTTACDAFRWADDVCDLFGSELTDSFQEVYTYSVHRATGKTTQMLECVWNSPSNRSFPPEVDVQAAGRLNLWRMVAWGRRVLGLYGMGDTYGGYANNNMMVLESDYSLLRLGAGIVPAMKRKLRSMEDVWLHKKIIEPQIAVLQSRTSRICEWPWNQRVFAYRNFHKLLQGQNYHYAFVPEEFVLSDREDLSDYQVLVLPLVTQMPRGLTEKILPWVDSGGTLILGGVAGVFTPFGKPDGRLMQELFGDCTFERTGDLTWKITSSRLRTGVEAVDGDGQVLLTSYGNGQALLTADVGQPVARGGLAPDQPAGREILRLLDSHVKRPAWASGTPLEIVMHEGGDRMHLTLINPDLYSEARATIHLAGTYRLAVDRGIERGFAVPLRKEGAGQAFDIVLAHGEGTMIDLLREE